MHKIKTSSLVLFLIISCTAIAQQNRWQQRAEYKMDVKMDVKTHRFTGTQKLVYYNNSPDTLHRVFYHLYFNAFQPNSMMDVRSRNIVDADSRVKDRISKLSEDEIGFQKVTSLKQNGKPTQYQVEGTILEVRLVKPIMPKSKTTFDMEFNGQVPVQIRRTGRNNKEDISYSMSQWYPKMSEYDFRGWHANPYIAREFHGVWGDFDVKITIDANYTLGGTGYLQNPDQIGHGYQKEGVKVSHKSPELTWHFKAPNVHDFMWAADPDYIHKMVEVPDGPTLHFYYDKNTANIKAWERLPAYTVKAMQYMNEQFGVYPYKQFSVVQGGDGGMEYPMSTLISGSGSMNALLSVTVHEMIHSWYQGVLATNESLYPWMDEGFTSFAQYATLHHVKELSPDENPHSGSYRSYLFQATSGEEEPLRTHSDHYKTNRSYGINAYSKGSVFLKQLGYVIGKENLMIGMRRYYNTWKFKHPNSNDLMRIMEKVSGIELDWYFEHFINTTDQIDYGIKIVKENSEGAVVVLERIKEMMMPIDLEIEYMDGSKEAYYIPLRMMRGQKPAEDMETIRLSQTPWPWTHPTYELQLNKQKKDIKKIQIDPSSRMADVDRENNVMERTVDLVFKK
jgi:hypothetical protein